MSKTDIHNDRSQRFTAYIQFSMNDSFISHINVGDQRLYFSKYDKNATIADLSQQYSVINEGKQLTLQSQLFKIDPTTPLAQITSTPQKIQILEKVLMSCKQNQDPLQKIKQPDQKKLAEELVSFVEKHNQKVQNSKEFQNHDCVIKVMNYPQSAYAPQFNYFVKENTTFNQIAQFINKKSGKKVQLQSVQLSNGVTYNTNNLMNKPFSELKMNNKQLIFKFPKILALKKTNKFKIKLRNSPYNHQAIQLNVKEQDSILVLINSVKKIIDFNEDPLQVHDSESNLIKKEIWQYPINEFLCFRRFQFQFLYPTFINYQCNLLISNFPGKTYQLKYLVHKNSTFNHMVKFIRENINCHNANFQITDLKGNNYGSQLRDKNLFNLKIQEQAFRFVYIEPTCLISANTRVIVRIEEAEQLQQITVSELISSENINQLQIMTYNEEKHQMEFGRVNCFKKQTGYSRIMQLTLAGDKGIVNLDCSADCNVKTQNFTWKPVRMLKKGQKIMMLRSDLQTVHYAQILDLKQKAIQEKEQLFTLQVLPQHNFLANGIIVHNDQSYTFQVHFYEKNKPPRKQSLKCYLNEKLSQVPSFRGKKLTMGGLPLNNNLTFGDYQIYNFGAIFAFDQSYESKSKDFIISSWREESYKEQQVDQFLKDKWSSDYWGLRQSKIVQISKNLQNMKSVENPQQLLICPKMHLKKLNYVYNILPQNKPYQQNIMNNHFKPMVMINGSYKAIFQNLLKKLDNFVKSEADLLPLYMYTTDLLFRQLNNFLRMPVHPKSNSQYIQQMKQWYVFSNRLINSLSNLPEVEYTTLYRGMNNISIKDAFGTSKTKDQDRYLILDSFTSTSKNKQVALGFLKGHKSALMTIKSHSGKAVDKYSHYPTEGQVLLPPFLYFKITRFEENVGGIQEIDLQQIPFPKTDKKKLIFWVDDIPAGNRSLIENQFEPQGIEVVQVMSTSIMKIILRDFFGILQAIGKQIVIISDMGRYEDGAWNCEAGVDLFNLIYKQYGMSNKAIIFTMDEKRARNAISQRGINQSSWTVLVDQKRVVAQVMAEFNK